MPEQSGGKPHAEGTAAKEGCRLKGRCSDDHGEGRNARQYPAMRELERVTAGAEQP